MNRRDVFKLSVGALGFAQRELAAQEKVAKAVRGLPSPKIKDVRVIATAPAGLRLRPGVMARARRAQTSVMPSSFGVLSGP